MSVLKTEVREIVVGVDVANTPDRTVWTCVRHWENHWGEAQRAIGIGSTAEEAERHADFAAKEAGYTGRQT